MAVFQCPVCELRFAFNTELEEHIRDAHPDLQVEHETLEDQLMAKRRRRRESDRKNR